MILVVIGVEGSGHHALHDLLRSATPSVQTSLGMEQTGSIGGPVAWQLEQEIHSRTRRWSRLLSIPRDANPPPRRRGIFRPLAFMRQSSAPSLGGLVPYEEVLLSESIVSSLDSSQWVVIDSSIPFYSGWDRDSLLYIDFVKLAEFLPMDTTRVIFLDRSPREAAISVYRRGIEPTLDRACRSTFNACLVANASRAALDQFQPFVIHYDQLVAEPSEVCRELETFLGIVAGALDEKRIGRRPHVLSEEEAHVLDEYWTDARLQLVGS